MKKILMISGAALLAASAMAVGPTKTAAIESLKGAKMQRMDMTAKFAGKKVATAVEAMKKNRVSILNQDLADEVTPEVPGEEEPAATFAARYYYPPINTFYAGCTPDGYTFPYIVGEGEDELSVLWGLSGNKGVIPFLNLSSEAQAYEWAYDFMGPRDEEYAPMTSEEKNLVIPVEGPYQFFTAPTLTAFNGDEQNSYKGQYVSRYISGPDFSSFGVYPSNIFSDWDEAESDADYWGVGTCPVNIHVAGNTYTYEFAVNRAPAADDADYYNENGACMQYVNALNKIYGEKYDISNVTVGSYIAILPEQTQAYLLDETWFMPYYTSTADITLTVDVCGLTEDGYIDRAHPIGSGEVVLPAHPKKPATELAFVTLEAVDEDGFPTSNPLVIDGEAYVFISGFNDPAVSYFTMFFNGGTTFDDAEAKNGVSDYYACNSMMAFEFEAKEKGVENAEPLYGNRIWSTDLFTYGQKAPYWGATDFNISYNILFPYVTNNDGGEELIVDAPTEGGEIEYTFDAYFLMSALIDEGVMTTEVSGDDFFTYEAVRGTVTIDGKDYVTNQVNIKAEPLPAGVEGRKGIIKFRGFASDFDIVVNQGDVSGISNVAAANGPVEYFDLQGRKLNAAPANGLYIQRQGNKATKCIAK